MQNVGVTVGTGVGVQVAQNSGGMSVARSPPATASGGGYSNNNAMNWSTTMPTISQNSKWRSLYIVYTSLSPFGLPAPSR